MTPAEKNTNLKPFFSLVILFSGITLIIILDQIFKHKIRSTGGFYVCNNGISFSLALNPIVFWVILFLFLIIVSFYLKYLIKNALLTPLSISVFILMLGGALSNAIDRFFNGCVTDFLSINYSLLPIFNPADIAISMGGFLLFICLFLKKECFYV